MSQTRPTLYLESRSPIGAFRGKIVTGKSQVVNRMVTPRKFWDQLCYFNHRISRSKMKHFYYLFYSIHLGKLRTICQWDVLKNPELRILTSTIEQRNFITTRMFNIISIFIAFKKSQILFIGCSTQKYFRNNFLEAIILIKLLKSLIHYSIIFLSSEFWITNVQ